ncbi:MAG: LysR family transcriptional regulator [Gammaproteobacteria bacterium]|nr:LysR family transcriptional regulator [Gammaproteobacteria bacterium]
MMPSVAELTYFFEVTNTKNLSHAAKNLCISQPALTRAIQHLEASLGAELFIRHQKGMTLTRAGKKMLLQIKPLLQCWHNTKLEALASNQRIAGQVRIGCHTTIGIFLHNILLELLEKYPELNIEIYNATSNIINHEVSNLMIDIGIVINPIQHPDLIIRKISQTETSLWTGEGKRKIQNIHSKDTVIICNPTFRHTQLIFQKCKIAHLKSKRILNVSSVEVIANLTAKGCGIGILPSSFVESLYPTALHRIPNAPIVVDELYIIYRKEYKEIQAIKKVISAIQKFV